MAEEYGFIDIDYISEERGGVPGDAPAPPPPVTGGHYKSVGTTAEMYALSDIDTPVGSMIYVQAEHAWYTRNDNLRVGGPPDWRKTHDEPADPSYDHTWEWVPDNGPRGGHEQWVDGRERLAVVAQLSDLSDRTILPTSSIEVGKLVWVKSQNKLYELRKDATTRTDTLDDWAAFTSGVTYVANVGNLPTKAEPGELFIIRQRVDGTNDHYRLVSWDPLMRPAIGQPVPLTTRIGGGATTGIGGLAADMLAQPMDAAHAGQYYDIAAGGGPWTFGNVPAPGTLGMIAGTPPSLDGQVMKTGDKIVNLGNAALGFGGWGIVTDRTAPNWVPTAAVPGAAGAGGWRYINRKVWIKPTKVTPDIGDGRNGDLQTTLEKDHTELKVFDGTSWRLLFGEDAIKEWIAALSLFEGTTEQAGGGNPGAIDLAALPALSATKTGHYYTWVGSPSFAVTGTTPSIGADLAGAVLNPGDWLQMANRGTAAVPDMHWVQVGGDLLAKSRGDNLYGMQLWADGGWESGSLVLHNGTLYRATNDIIGGDQEPGTSVAGSVTGNAARVGSFDTEVMANGIQDFNAPSVANKGRWWQNDAGAAVTPSTGPLAGTAIPDGAALLNLGDVNLGTGGWAIVPSPFAMGVPTFGASPNKWSPVDFGAGGVDSVLTDGDLPATAPASDVYLVINSARAGGKPALYSYDTASADWVMLGGSGVPLDLTQAVEYVHAEPKVFSAAYNVAPTEAARFVGDIAFNMTEGRITHASSDGLTWTHVPHPQAHLNGMICAFSEAKSDANWHYCDGTAATGSVTRASKSTPDLRGRFIGGAGSGLNNVNITGGSATHTHTVPRGAYGTDVSGFTKSGDWAARANHTHTASSSRNLPPYRGVYFYMFLI